MKMIPLLAMLPGLVSFAEISVLSGATAHAQAIEEVYYITNDADGGDGGCRDSGWPDGGGSWEDWTDMIAETGCIPEAYDYYMLPDSSAPSAPSTADDTPTWAPGEDPPATAPDNCDFYDWTRDPWIYLMWGCG